METVVYKKIIALIIVLLIVVNCSEPNSELNGLPSSFDISIISISENEAKIAWTPSVDPEGSTVFYDIYLEDVKLMDNIIELNFTFDNLDENTIYNGKVIASDPEGNTTTSTFTFETSINQSPTQFNTSIISTNPFYSRLEWEESIDPEGENIVYNIYLNEELVGEDITNFYFIFNVLKGLEQYNGFVEAVDAFGKTTRSTFSFNTTIKVYDDTLLLDTQTKVEIFGNQGYNKIDGNLIIGSLNTNITNVSDLSSLSTLKFVTRDLYIEKTRCQTLMGLQNLKLLSSYARLNINENVELVNLDGLSSITNLYIFELKFNDVLLNINGLSNLNTVNHYVAIKVNQLLNSLNGFHNIQTMRNLEIFNNDSLTNLNGLENIIYLNKFSVSGNDILTDLNGIRNLENCSDLFIISNNHNLSSLSSFSNLHNVDEVHIENNSSLTTLHGLENLTQVKYSIKISRNSSLVSLAGIENVNFIDNPANTHGIFISYNDLITNLDALDNYTFDRGAIVINNNLQLSDFCGLTRILTEISDLTTTHYIYNNNYNPSQTDILNGNCSN